MRRARVLALTVSASLIVSSTILPAAAQSVQGPDPNVKPGRGAASWDARQNEPLRSEARAKRKVSAVEGDFSNPPPVETFSEPSAIDPPTAATDSAESAPGAENEKPATDEPRIKDGKVQTPRAGQVGVYGSGAGGARVALLPVDGESGLIISGATAKKREKAQVGEVEKTPTGERRRFDDGTVTEVIAGGPVGDPTLERVGTRIKAKDSKLDATLGADAAEPTLAVNDGGASITLSPRGNRPEPSADGAKAMYKDVWPGIDLTYELSATAVKENIVVHQIPGPAPTITSSVASPAATTIPELGSTQETSSL